MCARVMRDWTKSGNKVSGRRTAGSRRPHLAARAVCIGATEDPEVHPTDGSSDRSSIRSRRPRTSRASLHGVRHAVRHGREVPESSPQMVDNYDVSADELSTRSRCATGSSSTTASRALRRLHRVARMMGASAMRSARRSPKRPSCRPTSAQRTSGSSGSEVAYVRNNDYVPCKGRDCGGGARS